MTKAGIEPTIGTIAGIEPRREKKKNTSLFIERFYTVKNIYKFLLINKNI